MEKIWICGYRCITFDLRNEGIMAALKKQLERIYNANQCMDLSDVDYAIEETKRLCREFPSNIAPKKRLASLSKRREVLS